MINQDPHLVMLNMHEIVDCVSFMPLCAMNFAEYAIPMKAAFFVFASLSILVAGNKSYAQEYFYADSCPTPMSSWAGQGLCKTTPGYQVIPSPNGRHSGCPSGWASMQTASGTYCHIGSDNRKSLDAEDTQNEIMNLINSDFMDQLRF